MKTNITILLVCSWITAFSQHYAELKLNDLINAEEHSAIDLHKLTDEEKDNLRILLIDKILTWYEEGKKEGIRISTEYFMSEQHSLTNDAIESKINGEFNGWEGETLVKLINGQIWQQTEYYYTYTYSFMPNVLIYKTGTGYKMKVDGVDKAIGVRLIR